MVFMCLFKFLKENLETMVLLEVSVIVLGHRESCVFFWGGSSRALKPKQISEHVFLNQKVFGRKLHIYPSFLVAI